MLALHSDWCCDPCRDDPDGCRGFHQLLRWRQLLRADGVGWEDGQRRFVARGFGRNVARGIRRWDSRDHRRRCWCGWNRRGRQSLWRQRRGHGRGEPRWPRRRYRRRCRNRFVCDRRQRRQCRKRWQCRKRGWRRRWYWWRHRRQRRRWCCWAPQGVPGRSALRDPNRRRQRNGRPPDGPRISGDCRQRQNGRFTNGSGSRSRGHLQQR